MRLRDHSRLPPRCSFAERKPLSTDWPARAAAAQASGVAAAKRLRLRAPLAPLANTALRPRFYMVLRDAHGQEHRTPSRLQDLG